MAQQQRHFFAGRKANRQKADKIEPKVKEVKVLNTKPDELQDTDFKTLVFNFMTAAHAFKSALKNFKIGSDNYESYELQKKQVIKELSDIQNMIKLKILSLKKSQIHKTEGESSKTQNTPSSLQSLFSIQPELSKKSLSPECTGNTSVDSTSEAFSASKLMSLSKQSLCSTKSSQCDYLDDTDVDEGDFDDEKFKEFLLSVNCPFCLKREDNKDDLAKHLDKACTPFKTRIFVQRLDCPYSVFQLLPNNMFKCNICPNSVQSSLKKYFIHLQNATHILGYNKAASQKNFTEFIFCSSCKIQIPNNAKQMLFHVEHEVHERNRKEMPSSRFLRQRGIQCVYSKEKKFKCLKCPPAKSIHKSIKEILGHVELEEHVSLSLSDNSQRRSTYTVYCVFCLAEVKVFDVIKHFYYSNEHAQKLEEESNTEFQLCIYCGFKCSKLVDLAQHMDDCLDKIRQKDNHPESEEFDKDLRQTEKDQERPAEENTSEEGRCIVVEGYPKILELYHYFKQYGEIVEIEPSGENAVMIKFQEEKIVDNILEGWRPIEINGVKPKIKRKNLDSSDVMSESSGTSERKNPFDDGSDISSTSCDVSGICNFTLQKDFSKAALSDGTLKNLFIRVSSHLSYIALKPDCEDLLNIAGDCEQILKLGKCHSVGFLKCGLTFPVEEITLYCELSSSFIKEECLDDKSTSLTESVLFNENLCAKCVGLLKKADAVSRVSLREKSIPLVQFYHNKTRKLCTITFRQSDSILSDELRYCLQDNPVLRSFVLIIRFWLSVHRLEIREFESVIISLLLFFILSSKLVDRPSENFMKRRKDVLESHCLRSQGLTEPKGETVMMRKEYSVVELFQNFLLFLSEFDFENMAICLPLLYPVPKTRLLQEPLKKYLCKWFNPDSSVWIMDPFLYNNLAVDVKKPDLDSLLKTVKETVEHYHIRGKT